MVAHRVRYRPTALKQKLRFEGVLIGCTDTVFAMLVDATTLGGCRVTEAQVRNLSDESHPDPNSPGLNLAQLEVVARKLHVAFKSRKGSNRAELLDSLSINKRVLAQLWYAGIGGTNIGHAIYIERQTAGNMLDIVDPIKGKRETMPQHRVFEAMETFARKNGLASGLFWGETRATQWMSTNQKAQEIG